jgi:hypothetical protein
MAVRLGWKDDSQYEYPSLLAYPGVPEHGQLRGRKRLLIQQWEIYFQDVDRRAFWSLTISRALQG